MSDTSSAASTAKMPEMYQDAAKGSMGSEETIKAAEAVYVNMTVASMDGRKFTQASETNVRLMSGGTDRADDGFITVSPDGEDIHTLNQ